MQELIRQFAIVGLGKMGANLAESALHKKYSVAGIDPKGAPENLKKLGLKAMQVADLGSLPRPRFVMLYVPAGPLVDKLLDQLAAILAPGDIVADGGNSYWGDSVRRHAKLKDKGIDFIDAGTSGGPGGALDGACFMIGGEDIPVQQVELLLRSLSVEGGYIHAGGPGSGHFVKLVHNGIEFGMLQAIAEGMDLLTHFREPLPIADLLQCWQHGSVVRSWLIELMEKMYRDQRGMANVQPYVEDTGEVNWLVDDAMHMEVSVPVIAQSVMALIASRDKTENWARAIAMMRHGFGGHPYGADTGIQHERHTGRVGGYPPPEKVGQ
jgi:6-phosphogluconate dehydrogenase